MRTLKRAALLRSLQASRVALREKAATLVKRGPDSHRCEVRIAASDLLQTYEVRLEHLRSKAGEHAEQLRVAVAEFCDALKTYSGSCTSLELAMDGPFSLILFIAIDDARILGCLPVASKLAMSREEWERLWSHSAT